MVVAAVAVAALQWWLGAVVVAAAAWRQHGGGSFVAVVVVHVGMSVSNWGPSCQENVPFLQTLHTSAPQPAKIGNWDWPDQPEPNAGCQLLTLSV